MAKSIVVSFLRDFIAANRAEILARARLRVAARNAPVATEAELSNGLPVFLEQLQEALRTMPSREPLDQTAIRESATEPGNDLFLHGLTVGQVVHDYGDLCQVITTLAVERDAPIPPGDFQALNRCVDDAIAGAVASYSNLRERAVADEGGERLGALALEMRNLVNAALVSFASIKRGDAGTGGSTSAVHHRSLVRLRSLIDRSLADVRVDVGLPSLDRVAICDIIDEVEVGASVVALARRVRLAVTSVDPSVVVDADRQSLVAAIANLVQNALELTRSGATVWLTASATENRVLLAVEDENGGFRDGDPEKLLRLSVQAGDDRSAAGLGLAVCRKVVKAIGGDLHIRNFPGRGCIFAVDLPRLLPG